MTLPDSGARKEFKTGAVRDISEGKGRCDLLPLDVIDRVLDTYKEWEVFRIGTTSPLPTVLDSIDYYLVHGETDALFAAINRFIDDAFDCDPFEAILELSKHYEDGAKKYSPNNWKLGIDLHCFIDSAVRHYIKWLRGDEDERHDRAVLWNLVGAIWTHENKPELNDIVKESAAVAKYCHNDVIATEKVREYLGIQSPSKRMLDGMVEDKVTDGLKKISEED